MRKFKLIFTAAALLTAALCSNQAHAVPAFGTDLNNAYPGKNLYGSCTVCHQNANDDPSWFSRYGRILRGGGADDDMASISGIINFVDDFDYDNDGFTLYQEAMSGNTAEGRIGSFSAGSLSGTPALLQAATATHEAAQLYANAVYARALKNQSITALTLSTTPAAVTAATFPGYANRGGVVDVYTTTAANTSVTLELLFKTGAIHFSNHQVLFINDAGAVSNITAIPGVVVNDAVDDGNIEISIADDGPYDLVKVSDYQAAAIARTPTFAPTAAFDSYASVSPYANISPLAIVDPYAVIDAYAIVDDYAEVQANATVRSYAYIGKNVLLSAGVTVDPYVDVTSDLAAGTASNPVVGVVKSRLAITTAVPLAKADPGDGTPGSTSGGTATGTNGSLHCVTQGLGAQGMIFFALLGAGFLLRRKHQA